MLIQAEMLAQLIKDLPSIDIEESVVGSYIQGPDARIKVRFFRAIFPDGTKSWVLDVASAEQIG